jgi:hypothetical protein
MGGEQSRPAPQAEKPRRERKKPEHKNKNEKEKENSTNIKDYPALHLKLITNIVCDKRTEHNSLSGEEITKLLSKIHKLSSPKEMK